MDRKVTKRALLDFADRVLQLLDIEVNDPDIELAMSTLASETREMIHPAWDQERITDWAAQTFGPSKSNLTIAIRANEEMAELLKCLSRDDSDQHARVEIADIIITLCRLASNLGGDMAQDIDAKMERNVLRRWTLHGDGTAQHVK